MREFTALMREVHAYGEANEQYEACPSYGGAALEDPMKSALEVRRLAAAKLAKAARTYFRAHRKRSPA